MFEKFLLKNKSHVQWQFGHVNSRKSPCFQWIKRLNIRRISRDHTQMIFFLAVSLKIINTLITFRYLLNHLFASTHFICINYQVREFVVDKTVERILVLVVLLNHFVGFFELFFTNGYKLVVRFEIEFVIGLLNKRSFIFERLT